ncbi:MAG: hypothetical protein LBH54_01300, partial [Clostridiales bacterium]|nr:hypothetical protein [Clostridiales bacterium]
KYSILDASVGKDIPVPKSDIYIKVASGKAIENRDGILESVIGSVTAVGTDADGAEHTYSVDISIEVTDIGATVVDAPDLSGKEVEYNTDNRSTALDGKYIGTYKIDIVTVRDGAFVKEGERVLELTDAAGGTLSGKYYEVYYDGYSGERTAPFEFTAVEDRRAYAMFFDYPDADGKSATGIITPMEGHNVRFTLAVQRSGVSGWSSNTDAWEFIRVFN